jgi:hypothetical protein
MQFFPSLKLNLSTVKPSSFIVSDIHFHFHLGILLQLMIIPLSDFFGRRGIMHALKSSWARTVVPIRYHQQGKNLSWCFPGASNLIGHIFYYFTVFLNECAQWMYLWAYPFFHWKKAKYHHSFVPSSLLWKR